MALPDFVTGECVTTDDGATFFAITLLGGDGPRVNEVNSETSIPWGLHPIDYNLALGDLVALVSAQAAAMGSAEEPYDGE